MAGRDGRGRSRPPPAAAAAGRAASRGAWSRADCQGLSRQPTRMVRPGPVSMATVARKGSHCGQFVAAVASKGAATAPRREGRFNRPAGGRKTDPEEYQRLAQTRMARPIIIMIMMAAAARKGRY